jgi:nicotinamidase-related amidase
MVDALVVIDVVTDIFELPVPLHEPDRLVARISELLARARAAGALIVHVQPTGPEGTRYAPGASGRRFHAKTGPLEGETIVEKYHPDAFQGSALEELLRGRGARAVAMCGFATDYCVDSTVRSGYAHGFEVTLAADAHTTTANAVLSAADTVAHHNVVLKRFGHVVPASEIDFEFRRAS